MSYCATNPAVCNELGVTITEAVFGDAAMGGTALGTLGAGGVLVKEWGAGANVPKGATAAFPSNAITDVRAISSAQANAPFVARGWNPPYDAGSQVRTFTTNTDIQFVRVSTVDNPHGAFLVRADEISGMTPLEIQQHLALPKVPTQIADVTVPAGTHMQVGRVAAQPAFGANNKGGVQYQLLDQIPSSNFGVPRPLR